MAESIGNRGDTPEQAIRRAGYLVLKRYDSGVIAVRIGDAACYVYLEDGQPVIRELSTFNSVGEYDDTPEHAAVRAGYRVVKTHSDGSVEAVDDIGRLLSIKQTGNGPWESFMGWESVGSAHEKPRKAPPKKRGRP